MFKRYWFVKKLYPKYVILIKRNDKYTSLYIDREILRLYDIEDLEINRVNYIILDNTYIEKKICYIDNNYDKYYYLCKMHLFIELTYQLLTKI